MTQRLPGNMGIQKIQCWGPGGPAAPPTAEQAAGALRAQHGCPLELGQAVQARQGESPRRFGSRARPALAFLQVEADELLDAPAVLELRGAAARQEACLARGSLGLPHLLSHAGQPEPGRAAG